MITRQNIKRYDWGELYDSDRSGFTYRKIDLVEQNGGLVHPDEWDEPSYEDHRQGDEAA